MISTVYQLVSSVYPVSACTLMLHSLPLQSVTSYVTCIGLRYVHAYITRGLYATYVRSTDCLHEEFRTLGYPSFTLLLAQWKRTFFSTKRGRGTDRSCYGSSLQTVNSLKISDLGKTLTSRIVKITLSKQKTYCNVFLSRKKGEWHGSSDSGRHAVLSTLALQNRS